MKIAVLLTCFNRKEKTLSCLNSLYLALEAYNNKSEDKIELSIYLTDDACTDGTGEAVKNNFIDKDITILQGTGSLYWAGGMRLAWNEALKKHNEWDFYLLLNDDTDIFPKSFSLLMQTHQYSMEHYGMGGVYTGATCAKDDSTLCTYGGDVWVNRMKGTTRRLSPIGIPQMCVMTNANVLLVASEVVDKIGIFSKDYQHGMADSDYGIRAGKSGIPVLLTSEYCGACDNDHTEHKVVAECICAMSLTERRRYFKHPMHSNSDYLRFIRNTSPMRLPMVWLGRMLNLYFPRFYYKLNNSR